MAIRKEPVASLHAPDVRLKMVNGMAQRVIDLYEHAISDILESNKSETQVSIEMMRLQEIIGTPELHDDVMEKVATAFELNGFRTRKASGRLVYPKARTRSIHREHTISSLTIHW